MSSLTTYYRYYTEEEWCALAGDNVDSESLPETPDIYAGLQNMRHIDSACESKHGRESICYNLYKGGVNGWPEGQIAVYTLKDVTSEGVIGCVSVLTTMSLSVEKVRTFIDEFRAAGFADGYASFKVRPCESHAMYITYLEKCDCLLEDLERTVSV